MYDNYSLTSGFQKREVQTFGIAGYVDMGFAHYLVIVTKREPVCSISVLKIWRIIQVSLLLVHKNSSLTLDEVGN